jgi:hypothetical protein
MLKRSLRIIQSTRSAVRVVPIVMLSGLPSLATLLCWRIALLRKVQSPTSMLTGDLRTRRRRRMYCFRTTTLSCLNNYYTQNWARQRHKPMHRWETISSPPVDRLTTSILWTLSKLGVLVIWLMVLMYVMFKWPEETGKETMPSLNMQITIKT